MRLEKNKMDCFKKIGEFKFAWTPNLIGKHLLKIEVYEKDELLEHIETAVGVYGTFEDKLAKVEMVI